MISINLKQMIAATPVQIRDVMLEHQQLNRFFNADFLLIKEQSEGEIKGGKGAVRQVNISGIKFEEQIISADNNHISYQIIGNKPVADHRGEIHFSIDNNAATPMTEITYKICCKTPWWLPSFILSLFVKKDITLALKKLSLSFNNAEV